MPNWTLFKTATVLVLLLSTTIAHAGNINNNNNNITLTFQSFGSELWSPHPSLAQDGHVQFGTSLLLSANGMRLFTGTPYFDYNDDGVNPGGGAVFLYDYLTDSGQWHLTWALYGEPSEGLGRNIAMSANGELLAVRRKNQGDIHVYDTNGNLVGQPIQGCLGYDMEVTDNYYLAASCDAADALRGRVNVYQLANNNGGNGTWQLVFTMPGDQAGDRFGMRTSLDATSDASRRFRLAVSAPNARNRTGYVRVYDVLLNGSYQQVGHDLLGQQQGETFGFALSMSETSQSTLAVGAPQSLGGYGSVRMFDFERTINGTTWNIVDKFVGAESNSSLGRNLAMTPDSERLVLPSYRDNRYTGLVQVYQRQVNNSYIQVAYLPGDAPIARWGSEVAISSSGAVLASSSTFKLDNGGKSLGSIHVLIDKTPFCSVPIGSGDPWVLREQCLMDGKLVVNDQLTCESLTIAHNGQQVPCFWIDPGYLQNNGPVPSSQNTPWPTYFHTFAPNVARTTSAPAVGFHTALPTVLHTAAPTVFLHTQSPTVIWKTLLPSAAKPLNKSSNATSLHSRSPSTAPSKAVPSDVLQGCSCDHNGHCIGTALQRGSNLRVCIVSRRAGLKLLDVSDFSLQRGGSRTVVIDANGPHGTGVATACSDGSCTVRTPVNDVYFDAKDASDMYAFGTIIVAYPKSRRLRRGLVEAGAHKLQSNFAVIVTLDQTSNGTGGDKGSGGKYFWILLVLMVVLVMMCCCFITRKRRAGRALASKNDAVDRKYDKHNMDDEDDKCENESQLKWYQH
jgi:hypothetical protein